MNISWYFVVEQNHYNLCCLLEIDISAFWFLTNEPIASLFCGWSPHNKHCYVCTELDHISHIKLYMVKCRYQMNFQLGINLQSKFMGRGSYTIGLRPVLLMCALTISTYYWLVKYCIWYSAWVRNENNFWGKIRPELNISYNFYINEPQTNFI